MNQTDSFKASVTRVKQLTPASYCDCYLTGTQSAWSWGWLIIAASRLPPATTKGAGYVASRTASHRDPSWQPSFQHLHLWSANHRLQKLCICNELAIMYAVGDWQTVEGSQQRHDKRKWIPPDEDVTTRYYKRSVGSRTVTRKPSIRTSRLCKGTDILKLTKTPLIYSVSCFNLRLGVLFGGLSPPSYQTSWQSSTSTTRKLNVSWKPTTTTKPCPFAPSPHTPE